MLTSLPSVLIIPSILLAGKLAVTGDKLTILVTGLCIFVISSILYYFAESMNALLWISLLLGVGAGIIIPLSTGLINDFFTGKFRIRQFGISSFITNFTMVLATALTGWLAEINWHYPFFIYMLPAVPIALSYFLTGHYARKFAGSSGDTNAQIHPFFNPSVSSPVAQPVKKKPIMGVMLLYFLATTIVLIIPFNIPILIQGYQLSSAWAGSMLSIFFLAMMLPGLILKELVEWLSNFTVAVSFAGMTLGLMVINLTHNPLLLALGISMVGFSYGVVQPFIYEKTASLSNHQQATFSLALVMSMNYASIVLFPLIMDGINTVFQTGDSNLLPFWIFVLASLIMFLFSFVMRGSNTLSITGLK